MPALREESKLLGIALDTMELNKSTEVKSISDVLGETFVDLFSEIKNYFSPSEATTKEPGAQEYYIPEKNKMDDLNIQLQEYFSPSNPIRMEYYIEDPDVYKQRIKKEGQPTTEQPPVEVVDTYSPQKMEGINEPKGGGLDDLFYSGIKLAEGTHGKTTAGLYTPVDTNDSREKNFKIKSKDIGYGHKVKDSETAAKEIYGIPFINAAGDFIPLTEAQVETIYKEDMKVNLDLARKAGWDKKLKDMGTTWEALPIQYKLPLMSLAYNVGGTTAGKEWEEVLRGAKDKDIQYFATHLRREDGGKFTTGMDNRVIKELKAARLISNSSEVTGVLPEANI